MDLQYFLNHPRTPALIGRMWRGEYPLWVMFWFCLVFGSVASLIIITIVFIAAAGAAYRLTHVREFAFALVFVGQVGWILYLVLALVGTWQSASKYNASPTLRIVTKIVLIFWAIGLMQVIYNRITGTR